MILVLVHSRKLEVVCGHGAQKSLTWGIQPSATQGGHPALDMSLNWDEYKYKYLQKNHAKYWIDDSLDIGLNKSILLKLILLTYFYFFNMITSKFGIAYVVPAVMLESAHLVLASS